MMLRFLFRRRKKSKKQINKLIYKFYPDIDEIVAAGKIEILRYMNNTIDDAAAKRIFVYAFFCHSMMKKIDEEKLRNSLDIAFPGIITIEEHKQILNYLNALLWARALGLQMVPTDNPNLYYYRQKNKIEKT